MLCQHQIRPWQRLFFSFCARAKMAQQRRHCSWYTSYTNFIAIAPKVGTAALNLPAGDCIPLWTPPAPRPPEVDTAGASPYDAKPSCWHTMAWHLPQRASSDGPSAVLAPTADSRAYKSARLLRCPVGPQMRPIDALLGVLSSPNPPKLGARPQTPIGEEEH